MRPLPEPIDVALSLISTNSPFQVRCDGLDEEHVAALIAACEAESAALPPVILARREDSDGVFYFIIDGHHEVEAQHRAGRDRVSAIVLDLADEEAIDLGWERNSRNAKNLSLEDRIAHADLLRARRPTLPKNEIARICGISRTTEWRSRDDVSRKRKAAPHPIVVYLRRIALDPTGWDSAKDAAAEIRAAIPKDDLDDFAQRLGGSALSALAVAEELGFKL